MAQPKSVQMITPPNTLKAKVGGSMPKIDADAIARAEKALQSLSVQFEDWMNDELDKLEKAWAAVQESGIDSKAGEALYRSSHDVKGLGATYEFPLVTRLAGSLCKLIESPERRAVAPQVLVEGLFNGIRVAIRDKIRNEEHPAGKALAEESEAIVAHFLKSFVD